MGQDVNLRAVRNLLSGAVFELVPCLGWQLLYWSAALPAYSGCLCRKFAGAGIMTFTVRSISVSYDV